MKLKNNSINNIYFYQKDINFHSQYFGFTSIKNISPINMFESGFISKEELYQFRNESICSSEVIEYLKNNLPDLYEKYSLELNLTGF